MAKKKNTLKEKPKNETNISNTKKKFIIPVGAIILIAVIAYAYFNNSSKEEFPGNQNESNESVQQNAYDFKKEGELTFRSSSDEFISQIDIEMAGDSDERSTGLMYRDDLQENQGMFFIFGHEVLQSFWMKNTFISLDIIFVNKNNEIVKIHKSTTPLSEESYPSGKPAKYVVEVIAGYTDKFGIKEGDNIVWRRF